MDVELIKAHETADHIISDLATWGFMQFIGNGKYHPTTIKRCGTCRYFQFILGSHGQGACALAKTTYPMTYSCKKHGYNKLLDNLIMLGLPVLDEIK